MAYSYVLYNGDGATSNFSFTFPYIEPSHVKVRVDGTLTSYSFLNSSTVTISPAPAVGAVIEIRRETPKDAAPVDFADGSVLLERDLDLLAQFSLFAAQESEDDVSQAIIQDSTGVWDAKDRRIRNLADPIDPQDAVTKQHLEYEYPNVSIVANNVAAVNTVAPSIAGVNTVAQNVTSVNTTAANIANVNKVAAVDVNVTKVANIDGDVTTVAGNTTNVSTVAQSISGVNTTAGSIANVNTTAGNIADVNTVAGSITNVNRVGTDITSVNTVAGIADAVVTVANNELDVQLLADEIAKVQTVASDLNETVSEIEVVANNIATVEVVANNIQAVTDAYANANTATTKAAEALASEQAAAVSASEAEADRVAAEAARDRAEGAADATTTNTVIPTQNIVSDGGTTFTINRSVSYAGSILVECAGVTQTPLEAYTVVSGDQLTFTEAIPAGVVISVRWLDKESQSGAALSLEWATQDRDVYVSGSTEYSSKHYALNSADSAAASAASAAAALASQQAALVSEQASDVSEAFALQYRNEAEGFRNEAQAFAAAAGGAGNSVPIEFTANGTQTDFPLTTAAQNNQSILVTVNYVLQDMFNAYTLVDAGATLRFDQAPVNGAKIIVRYL